MSVLTVHSTDALSALRQMPDESVQCVVTSPPYWSLRDYGIEPIVWDETVECDHEFQDTTYVRNNDQTAGPKQRTNVGAVGRDVPVINGFCFCGAWRGNLGLEPTPELYVQHIVQIFREVKRVLRKDGTLWLNLGDSYAGGGNGGGGSFAKDGIRCALPGTDKNKTHRYGSRGVTVKSKRIPRGSGRWGGGNAIAVGDLKPKDLVGIPWMVAFALRSDGWWLRSDIIWSKSNPMPESVADRPTRSHEYVFLLTKNKTYFYDADAIREGAQLWTGQAATFERSGPVSEHVLPNQTAAQHRPNRNGKNSLRGQGANRTGANGPANREGRDMQEVGNGATRNKRSVWSIATSPFPEAHFATFPKDLVLPCVLAGSKAGDVVMDPFGGSGTVGKVAIELGRKAILIEPNPEYVKMIEKRTTTTMGLPL